MNARSERFDRDPAGWTTYLAEVESAGLPFEGRYRLRHFDYVHPVRLQPGTPRRLQRPYDLRLAYTDWGPHEAPLVLCCGGVANVALRFSPLANALAADHRVICFDWAGRGRSAWLHEEADYSLASCVEQLRQLIAHLGDRPVALVGSSLGGTVAIELAAAQPHLVNRLVLNDIGPAMPAERRRRRAETLARHYVFREPAELLRKLGAAQKNDGPASDSFRLFLAHHQTRWSEEEHGRIYRHDVRALQAYRRDAATPLAQWRAWQRVRSPLLLVHGLESDALLPATIRRMARSRPFSVMHVPRTGHTPLLSDSNQVGFIHDWLRTADPDAVEWTTLLEGVADQRAARQASTATSNSLTTNRAALTA